MALMRERRRTSPPTRPPSGGMAFASLDHLLAMKHKARGFSFLPRQPVHSLLVGRHASHLRGRGLDFEELRHYFEGDDTRTIDWPATARLGSPHVRVYTEERDRPVLLVVDQRSSMFFGSRRVMKSVAAAEAAALAAWRVTSLGDRVGALVVGDSAIVEVRPGVRDAGATRVIHAVAKANNGLGTGAPGAARDGQLNRALGHAARLATHDWLVCLISDAAGADEETRQHVTTITVHNDMLAVFVSDPLEEELPDVGRAVFAAGEAQIEVDTSASGLRRRFAEGRQTWRDSLAALSRKRAIPVLPISTGRDVADQLRELIGRHVARPR